MANHQNRPYRAVLLDLDGTLADTALDFTPVVNQLRQELGYPALTDIRIRQCVSHGSRALTTLATDLPDTHPEFEHHKSRLLSFYEEQNGQRTCLFDGLEALLAWLAEHKIPWGIVTNKPLRFTTPLLQALNLAYVNSALVCPDHVQNVKPHPEPLFLAAEQLNIPASDCLYIGDHERDIRAGKAAGMYTIAALYGYIDPNDQPEQWGFHTAVNDSLQLMPLLQSLLST